MIFPKLRVRRSVSASLNDLAKDTVLLHKEALVLGSLYGRFFGAEEMEEATNSEKQQPPQSPFIKGEVKFADDPEKYAHIHVDKSRIESFQDSIPSSYDEALKWFAAQDVITDAGLKKLKQVQGAAAKKLSKDSINTIRTKVNAHIKNVAAKGLSRADWLGELSTIFDSIGITELNPSYWNLVMRNATQGAFNQGKVDIYREADDEEFPSMQIQTVEDNRVRASHARLHGFTAPKNDPVWNGLIPPFDHGCRCTIRAVHVSEGVADSSGKPDLSGVGFA